METINNFPANNIPSINAMYTAKTISRQTMNYINCLVGLSNIWDDVHDAIRFSHGDMQSDSLMNEKLNGKFIELKSVIQEFICDSINEKLLDKDNEI